MYFKKLFLLQQQNLKATKVGQLLFLQSDFLNFRPTSNSKL